MDSHLDLLHVSWTSTVFMLGLASLVPGIEGGTGLYMGPYFAEPEPKNITVHQGSVAYLPCVVKQLGDKSVSWIRQRDADILTVDTYTFVRDERFSVYFSIETNTWTLVIKSVQARDAGVYECQISTEPKMSFVINFHVLVPQVDLLGEKEKFVRVGSTTRLECRVTSAVQLPDYIFWYHKGERLLEYDNPRISISVSRQGGEKGQMMSLMSVLLIKRTQTEDKGNYSCIPSNLDSAFAFLHVLNGEHPAAMQTGSGMTVLPASTLHLVVVSSLISLLLPIFLFNPSKSASKLVKKKACLKLFSNCIFCSSFVDDIFRFMYKIYLYKTLLIRNDFALIIDWRLRGSVKE